MLAESSCGDFVKGQTICTHRLSSSIQCKPESTLRPPPLFFTQPSSSTISFSLFHKDDVSKPRFREKTILEHLSKVRQIKYDDTLHIKLLISLKKMMTPSDIKEYPLWSLISGEITGFVRFGVFWKNVGFLLEDPVLDFAATGILGLNCLHFIFSRHTKLFQTVIRFRCRRSDVDHSTYPLCLVILRLLEGLCVIFELMTPTGEHYDQSYSYKAYWSVVADTDGLFRVLIVAISLFEQLWEENQLTIIDPMREFVNMDKIIRDTLVQVESLLVCSAKNFFAEVEGPAKQYLIKTFL